MYDELRCYEEDSSIRPSIRPETKKHELLISH